MRSDGEGNDKREWMIEQVVSAGLARRQIEKCQTKKALMSEALSIVAGTHAQAHAQAHARAHTRAHTRARSRSAKPVKRPLRIHFKSANQTLQPVIPYRPRKHTLQARHTMGS